MLNEASASGQLHFSPPLWQFHGARSSSLVLDTDTGNGKHSACVPPTTRTNPSQWYLPSLVSDLCHGLVTLSLLACPGRNMTMPCLRQRLKTGRLATWMILIHTAVTLVSPPDTQIIPWVASSHARQAPVVNLDRYEGRREGRPPECPCQPLWAVCQLS